MTFASFASVGPLLPHDLFAASGRYAGSLGWTLGRPMPFAAQWMENRFAPWAASILEDWAAGAFDAHEAVVFARADDNAQRLYYYVCELRRRGVIAGGPEPLVFDSAQGPRASSLARTTQAVRGLAERLGVDDAALEAGIVATNSARPMLAAQPATSPTCLLIGTPPPDRALHDAIERQGWHADGAALADTWRDPGAAVDESTGDPGGAIARQIHTSVIGNRAFADRAAALRARLTATGAKAAVLWYSEDEEAEVWHLPDLRRVLDAAGVPALALTRRLWGPDPDAADRIGTFLKEIGT